MILGIERNKIPLATPGYAHGGTQTHTHTHTGIEYKKCMYWCISSAVQYLLRYQMSPGKAIGRETERLRRRQIGGKESEM